MKKLKNYIVVFLLIGLVACNNENKVKTKTQSSEVVEYSPLKERNGVLSQSADWPVIQGKVADLFTKIKSNPDDNKSKLLLAATYMQEARITGEHPYYYPATLVILDDVLKKDSNSFEALAFKSSVLLSLHHFSEALEVGNKAKTINANNGFIYGVLCDANVELGNYEEAIKMSDMMQTLRPGLESYSRVSYLREIYGENQAAIDAMKMAYQAGLPGSEEASWAGNTLVHLFECNGDLKNAEDLSKVILEQRPSYAFSTDALGSIAMQKGNYDTAIKYFDKAIESMPEYSFYEHKAEALMAKGETEKAKNIYKDVLKMLAEDAESGHYADMDMALVYSKLGDHENAMKYAKTEYDRRPKNIDVNTTMAWVLYKKGDFSEAKKHIDVAMKTGKKNAELLMKAAMIEKANGNTSASAELMKKAKTINSFIEKQMKAEA